MAYFPHYCEYEFSQFHHDLFEMWRSLRRSTKRCLAAPRGYAKSTFAAVIKPVHDVCYGLEKLTVVLSNTLPLASGKVKDIRAELLSNIALVEDYNIRFPTKRPAETSFQVTTDNGTSNFIAVGAGTEIRGLRVGQYRPTKIILDDTENSEEVLNEDLRDKMLNWYTDVISKLGSGTTNIEFVGTVLHPESLLMSLDQNPMYESKIYSSIINWADNESLWNEWRDIITDLDNEHRVDDADAFYNDNEEELLKGTKVLWPEKEPYIYLMKEIVETGMRSFMKEKQNTPMASDEAVFENFQYYKETEEGIYIEKSGHTIPWDHLHYVYGALDPSTGETKAKKGKLGDYTAIVTGYKCPKGRLLVHDAWLKKKPPTSWISEIFEKHDTFNYDGFAVETNLYRNLLIPNIIAERKKREDADKRKIMVPFYDVENIENKTKRIYTLEPKVSNGWIVFNRALDPKFMNQFRDFPHGSHDDGPDATEILWGMIKNRYRPSAMPVNAREER